jgi:hypothetical protein
MQPFWAQARSCGERLVCYRLYVVRCMYAVDKERYVKAGQR